MKYPTPLREFLYPVSADTSLRDLGFKRFRVKGVKGL
jgi:hypothetical protein